MPKLKANEVPSYRLHRQSGQAIVTLSGKDVLLGVHGTAASKAAYDRVTAEWLANGRRLAGAQPDITVAELIHAFWQHAKSHYADGRRHGAGEASNFKPVLRRLRRTYGGTLARDFGPLALKAFRSQLIQPQERLGSSSRSPCHCRRGEPARSSATGAAGAAPAAASALRAATTSAPRPTGVRSAGCALGSRSHQRPALRLGLRDGWRHGATVAEIGPARCLRPTAHRSARVARSTHFVNGTVEFHAVRGDSSAAHVGMLR